MCSPSAGGRDGSGVTPRRTQVPIRRPLVKNQPTTVFFKGTFEFVGTEADMF